MGPQATSERAMHGHALTFLLTAGGFIVALLALIFQILDFRREK
jgi:hypothetical protein